MVRVHVGVNFEYKTRELALRRLYLALYCLHSTRRRRNLHEAVKQLFDTECVERRPEEYRCDTTCKILLHIKLRVDAFNKLQVFAQLGCISVAHRLVNPRVVHVVDFHTLGGSLLVGSE